MPAPASRSRVSNCQSIRRGGTYIIVVGSALIVSTLGMMALLQQRIQRKGFEAAANMEQARLNIESAMRLGLLEIQRDPNWRSTYAANGGEVLTEMSSEFGSVTLHARDPHDNDLVDNAQDSVALRATASAGGATQYAELTMHPATVPPDVLWKGVVAGGDVSSTGGTVRSEKPVSCNASTLTSANMYADVEAVTLSGNWYHGTQTLVPAEDRPSLPGIDTVVSEYSSRGSAIDLLSLPTSTPSLVTNPGMEQGQGDGNPIDDWQSTPNPPESATCDVEQSTAFVQSGTYSMRVKNRSGWDAGPVQYCTEWVKPNTTYYVEAWIRPTNSVAEEFQFSWYTKGTASAGQWRTGGTTLALVGVWTKISAVMWAGSWSGDLESSYIKIQNTSGSENTDFYVDDFTIRQVDRYFLYRRVLSPNSNPFGSTNADGIYVIDCNNSSLVVERCRIQGTLVILNPGPDSAVEGPISWEPARPGYPALIVGSTPPFNSNMKIGPSRRGLSEAHNRTNYNPAGTPHRALGTDNDQNDILPSEIHGWLYVGDTLTFGNAPTIHGVVMAGNNIVINGKPHISWDPAPIYHPPPGLEGTLELKRREGASTKAVQ